MVRISDVWFYISIGSVLYMRYMVEPPHITIPEECQCRSKRNNRSNSVWSMLGNWIHLILSFVWPNLISVTIVSISWIKRSMKKFTFSKSPFDSIFYEQTTVIDSCEFFWVPFPTLVSSTRDSIRSLFLQNNQSNIKKFLLDQILLDCDS